MERHKEKNNGVVWQIHMDENRYRKDSNNLQILWLVSAENDLKERLQFI